MIANNSTVDANYMNSCNETVVIHNCIRNIPGLVAIFLAMIACPVYVLMFKILVYHFDLMVPRHKILLNLNISDSIQIAGMAILSLLGFIFQAKSRSAGCQVIRKVMEFLGIATVVSSTGSILLLSFERYIACVHCLRLYDIVTDNLVHRAIYCIWGVAFICGLADKERYQPNYTVVALVLTKSISIIYTIVVLSSTVLLAFVQFRLYRLSHMKNKVLPGDSFGRAAEENDTRRTQMKAAIVASAVVLMYVICMCPLAFYSISVGFDPKNDESAFRLICLILEQVNTVIDPFVYGYGMADTRKQMIKELNKIKNTFLIMVDRVRSGLH